jgi:hypothetical protein
VLAELRHVFDRDREMPGTGGTPLGVIHG